MASFLSLLLTHRQKKQERIFPFYLGNVDKVFSSIYFSPFCDLTRPSLEEEDLQRKRRRKK